jgi:hypothetical protein
VVLPAPGGATSTAVLLERKTAVSSGSAASMGSGEESIITSNLVFGASSAQAVVMDSKLPLRGFRNDAKILYY